MEVIACITDPEVAEKILKAMKLSTEVPPVEPARAPPQAVFDFDHATGSMAG